MSGRSGPTSSFPLHEADPNFGCPTLAAAKRPVRGHISLFTLPSTIMCTVALAPTNGTHPKAQVVLPQLMDRAQIIYPKRYRVDPRRSTLGLPKGCVMHLSAGKEVLLLIAAAQHWHSSSPAKSRLSRVSQAAGTSSACLPHLGTPHVGNREFV